MVVAHVLCHLCLRCASTILFTIIFLVFGGGYLDLVRVSSTLVRYLDNNPGVLRDDIMPSKRSAVGMLPKAQNYVRTSDIHSTICEFQTLGSHKRILH